jgi:hypothetical protein
MYEGVAEKLQDAIEIYYKWWVEKYPDEKIYSLCFFSEPSVSYAGVTVFTEEGLQKVAKEYKSLESLKSENIDSLTKDLRWSASDAPHQCENESIFENVNIDLSQIAEYTDSLEDDSKFNEHINVLYGLFVTALNGFRQSCLNGAQDIILSVWFGDQSEDEIGYFIKNCNGQELIEKFYSEWN